MCVYGQALSQYVKQMVPFKTKSSGYSPGEVLVTLELGLALQTPRASALGPGLKSECGWWFAKDSLGGA